MKKQKNISKYERALKHVTALKEFYQHLVVYAIFLIAWLIFKNQLITFVIEQTPDIEKGFLNWLKINIALVPVIWGVALLVQFLYLHRYKLSFFKNWEERKIKELLERDQF
ncbi:2TM domain-containing protein [Aureibaculum sp. 2210JD6-5]|uniref:2TM domain-containing protein n=1 Tax=Aureibaculum sp. 2210JD6-5 TaxID=3103957 RepID=UPI002AAE3597|nr:2TM domain-containing protein [Aureibaculum sp. 2210JD6-5]MDY7395515.1 2TM domain-containing protein [Aureibaculum sp. 2210JD6-5]